VKKKIRRQEVAALLRGLRRIPVRATRDRRPRKSRKDIELQKGRKLGRAMEKNVNPSEQNLREVRTKTVVRRTNEGGKRGGREREIKVQVSSALRTRMKLGKD